MDPLTCGLSLEALVDDDHIALPVEYHLAPTPDLNDARVAALPPDSVIANSTGLGKDRPGSPLTDAVIFPL